MQYNIQSILQSGEKVAVHVPTEDEAREVWKIVSPNYEFKGWSYNAEDPCINVNSGLWDRRSYYYGFGYTIIPASLFIEHNTPKVEKKPFAVKADSFELYERFKADVDKIGWMYDPGYTRVDRYNYDKNMIKNGEIVFLSECTYSVCDTVKCTTVIYQLETQYPEAIAAAKEWFEGDEVKAAPTNTELSESVKFWKRMHDDAKKENIQLKEALKNSSNKAGDLETQVKLLLKHNKDQHDRNNSKLMAVSILLSSFPLQATHRQKQFAVDCIKQHINELIEKEYDEPGALPF